MGYRLAYPPRHRVLHTQLAREEVSLNPKGTVCNKNMLTNTRRHGTARKRQ